MKIHKVLFSLSFRLPFFTKVLKRRKDDSTGNSSRESMWEIRPRLSPREGTIHVVTGKRITLVFPLGEHRNTLSSSSLSSPFETLYGSCQNYVSESKPEESLLSRNKNNTLCIPEINAPLRRNCHRSQ